MLALCSGCHAGQAIQTGPSREGDESISFPDEAGGSSLPASPEVLQAERALQAGELAEAERGFESALEREPADLRALLGLGLTQELLEQPGDAERAYRRALEVDAAFPEALNNLGALLREQRREAEAVSFFRQAIESRERYVDAHINLALALDQSDRFEEAAQAYSAAIALAPRDATLRANYGLCLLRSGDRENAATELRRALPLARGNPVALQAIGNGLRLAGRFDDAVRAMEGAVEAHPQAGTPALLAELALAYLATRDGAQAEETLGAALRLDPDYPTAHYLLGRVLRARGACDEAERHLRRYLSLEPNGAQVGAAQAAIRGCGPGR